MISFTKLRVIQQGAIFDYNSHLGETMVQRKLISTTDKQGANRPRKDDKHNQVSTKNAGRPQQKWYKPLWAVSVTSWHEWILHQTNAKQIIDWINLNSNYERLDIKNIAEEEKMRKKKLEKIIFLNHTSIKIDHPDERCPEENFSEVTDISTDDFRYGSWNVSHYHQSFWRLLSPRWSNSIRACNSCLNHFPGSSFFLLLSNIHTPQQIEIHSVQFCNLLSTYPEKRWTLNETSLPS